jgi:hypothetical protein
MYKCGLVWRLGVCLFCRAPDHTWDQSFSTWTTCNTLDTEIRKTVDISLELWDCLAQVGIVQNTFDNISVW